MKKRSGYEKALETAYRIGYEMAGEGASADTNPYSRRDYVDKWEEGRSAAVSETITEVSKWVDEKTRELEQGQALEELANKTASAAAYLLLISHLVSKARYSTPGELLNTIMESMPGDFKVEWAEEE